MHTQQFIKSFALTSIFLLPFMLPAQGDNDLSFSDQSYSMVTTIYLKPILGKVGDLKNGLRAHNEKYHTEAPNETMVWRVSNGPRSGSYVWMKGPHTFTDMDEPMGEGHGPDWGENVQANCTEIGPREFWRRNDELSKPPAAPAQISRVRFYAVNIEGRQGYRMPHVLKQMSEAMKALDGVNWSIHSNLFQQGKLGRHFAVVTGFENWAALDKGLGFIEAFEKIYGEGTHATWQREMGEVFSDSFDEFWVQTDL